MPDLKEEVSRLLNKAEWTDDEKRWLLQYLEDTKGEALHDLMQQEFDKDLHEGSRIDPEITIKMLQNIREGTGKLQPLKKAPVIKMWMQGAAGAAVIAILFFNVYPWLSKPPKQVKAAIAVQQKAPHKDEIQPGDNKAVLTLADGSTILLDDARNGDLTRQGSTKLIKVDGKLAYNQSGNEKQDILYNTVATPRGGQYQVQLPDGSRVWLNAASSLYFPTSFPGKERRVEVKGEAYFEVAKNASKPFIVKVNSAEIQVTGTHFNIMAYNNETIIKTTLLEGAVNFINGDNQVFLKPGQQSQLIKNGQVKVVSNVDLNEVVAWKNGLFDFNGEDIVFITNQLSRWYDVEIIFERKPDDLFYAQIPRNTKLTDVLKALELTGKVHFKIEGKKIVVAP